MKPLPNPGLIIISLFQSDGNHCKSFIYLINFQEKYM